MSMINACNFGSTVKDVKQVKTRWHDLQYITKKQQNRRKQAGSKTWINDIPEKLSDLEEKTLSVIGCILLNGILGGIFSIDGNNIERTEDGKDEGPSVIDKDQQHTCTVTKASSIVGMSFSAMLQSDDLFKKSAETASIPIPDAPVLKTSRTVRFISLPLIRIWTW